MPPSTLRLSCAILYPSTPSLSNSITISVMGRMYGLRPAQLMEPECTGTDQRLRCGEGNFPMRISAHPGHFISHRFFASNLNYKDISGFPLRTLVDLRDVASRPRYRGMSFAWARPLPSIHPMDPLPKGVMSDASNGVPLLSLPMIRAATGATGEIA